MSQAVLKVLQAGSEASVQDVGRRMAARQAFAEGGALDLHAYYWANRLLGNPPNTPVIEISLGLFAVEFLEPCCIAITGADLNATLNDEPLSTWQTHSVEQGDQLRFYRPVSGMRAYLAISGKLECKAFFTSVATVPRERSFGIGNQVLQKGDILSANGANTTLNKAITPTQFIPDYDTEPVLELIPSYQFAMFPQTAIEQFMSASFAVSAESNRMAVKLAGDGIVHGLADIASEGIAYGSVQVPPDSQPIVLLNDRQTIGGYPKLGCITRLSGARLAQCKPHSQVSFALIEIDKAIRQWRDFLAFFTVG